MLMNDILKDTDSGYRCLQIDTGKHNSLNLDFLDKALQEFVAWDKDDSTKAVLITGNERSFCTGADLGELSHYTEQQCIEFFLLFDKLIATIHDYRKPVVSVLKGHALGGGLSIVQASTLSLAIDVEKVKIGYPELKLGLSFTPTMIEIMKKKVRMNMIPVLTGAMLSPYEAQKAGFIDEVFVEDTTSKFVDFARLLSSIPGNAFEFFQSEVKGKLPMITLDYAVDVYKRIYKEIQVYISA